HRPERRRWRGERLLRDSRLSEEGSAVRRSRNATGARRRRRRRPPHRFPHLLRRPRRTDRRHICDDAALGGDRRADQPGPQEERPPLVTCPHCGSVVPSGDFCGHCGAHLTTGSVRRMNAYTAAPAQGVARVAIISTLFPHLPQRRGGPFRAALGAGAALVALLAGLHLFAPATTAAVLVLPVLYLMYLYEVEVYESEPWLVVGATLVAGAFLGLVFTNLTGGKLSQLVLTGDRDTALVLAGVVIPVVAQLLMLAVPVFLYILPGRFREP